jgi:hypothetical protein
VPAAGGLTNSSEVDVKQESDPGDIIDETGDTSLAEGPEQNTANKDHDAESIVDEDGTASQRRNIRDDLRSDEETFSIPDDSPSIQVW